MTPTATKTTAVNRRTHLRYLAVAVMVFVAGLALGAGRPEEDRSAANTASKLLLTIGFVALVVTGGLEVVRRLRARRANAAAR